MSILSARYSWPLGGLYESRTRASQSVKFVLHLAAASLLLASALAQAAQVTGAVTNKTTRKPAAGDSVVLVDAQAGMSEVAHTTTDANGRYLLNLPGNGPYLTRVTHQGVDYFLAAPQGGAPGNIPVFDVAAKVDGVSIEADVLEVETDNGQLRAIERYFVHNTGSPPRTEWSTRAFEVTLPPEAVITATSSRRPTGLPTSIKPDSMGTKGHYAFNFPIQPDEGDKDTLFQIEYTLPYTYGSYTFHTGVSVPAQSVGVLLPKSMTFAASSGSVFQAVPEDPTVQTFVARNAVPGKELAFTISGTGTIPRETQDGDGEQAGAVAENQPGGGIGEPINTPDPLSKYKGWILGGLALLLAAAAALLLRKPAGATATLETNGTANPSVAAPPAFAHFTAPAAKKAALLGVLKEEMFVLESEKFSGTLKTDEYNEVKTALETVLKRTLTRN